MEFERNHNQDPVLQQLDTGDIQLLQRALSELEKANGIMRFLSDHFRDKYNLTPAHQILPNGKITMADSMVVPNGIGSLQATSGSENG